MGAWHRPVELPLSGRTRRPWVNGQGWTGEVTGADGEDPGWRVNIADIPGDCAFSYLPGIDRRFMVLDDVDLTLELDGPRTCRTFEVVDFPGEAAPRCRASGPTRALNLLVRRGAVDAELRLVELTDPIEVPTPDGGCLVVVKIDGAAGWTAQRPLRSGDAIRLDHRSGWPEGLQLHGPGRVAVITIDPGRPATSRSFVPDGSRCAVDPPAAPGWTRPHCPHLMGSEES